LDDAKSTKGGDMMMVWIIMGLVLLLLIAVGLFYAAWRFDEFRATARDIAIIILAALQMIGAVLTVVLLVAVLYAVRVTQRIIVQNVIPNIEATRLKVDEVIDNTRAVTGTVRESAETTTTTTIFVAERVVSPVIRVSSLIAGVRAAVKSLARHDVESQERSSL